MRWVWAACVATACVGGEKDESGSTAETGDTDTDTITHESGTAGTSGGTGGTVTGTGHTGATPTDTAADTAPDTTTDTAHTGVTPTATGHTGAVAPPPSALFRRAEVALARVDCDDARCTVRAEVTGWVAEGWLVVERDGGAWVETHHLPSTQWDAGGRWDHLQATFGRVEAPLDVVPDVTSRAIGAPDATYAVAAFDARGRLTSCLSLGPTPADAQPLELDRCLRARPLTRRAR
ncbi:MAG: hypothetical protein ABMA64_18695 [Myxococcota bacterium]